MENGGLMLTYCERCGKLCEYDKQYCTRCAKEVTKGGGCGNSCCDTRCSS